MTILADSKDRQPLRVHGQIAGGQLWARETTVHSALRFRHSQHRHLKPYLTTGLLDIRLSNPTEMLHQNERHTYCVPHTKYGKTLRDLLSVTEHKS